MAAKISTIVMKVDLDCKSCYKKIRKTIISLQEKEKIETVVYDEKNNTVTVSGPFDPKRVCKKLCCRACKVIKDIRIKEDKPKEDSKPKKEEPKKEEPKKIEPKKEEPKKEEPKKVEPKKEEPKKEEPKKEEPKKEVPKKEEPKKEEPKPVKEDPVRECQPCWPGPVCSCGCKPWYGGYYGNNRCPWCGRGFDCEVMPPPQVVIQPPVYVYGAPEGCYGQKNCEFFYEEEPQAACSVM